MLQLSWDICHDNSMHFQFLKFICSFLFSITFRCIVDWKYKQAIAMAVKCQRLDKFEKSIKNIDNVHATLSYCMNCVNEFISSKKFRLQVNMVNAITICCSFFYVFLRIIAAKDDQQSSNLYNA